MKRFFELEDGHQIFIVGLATAIASANLICSFGFYSGWWALVSFPGIFLWFPPFAFLLAQMRLGRLREALARWWAYWGIDP